MTWTNALDILNGLVCYVTFLWLVNGALKPRRGPVALSGAVVFYALGTYLVRQADRFPFISAPVQLALLFAPVFVLYPRERFFRRAYCASVLLAGEMIAVPVSTLIVGLMTGGIDMDLGYAQTPVQLMRNGIEVALLLPILYLMLLPMRRGREEGVNWAGYTLFIAAQGLTMLVSMLVLWLNPHMISSQFYVLVFCVALNVAADIALYGTVKRNIRAARAESENVQLRRMQDVQMRHSLELQNQIEKTAVLRHDISNHLNTLGMLLREDAAGAAAYLNNLIQAQRRGAPTVFCGNPTVNAVVHVKAAAAEDRGVRMDARLTLPDAMRFDDVDLVGIFSNMLDNALEAFSGLGEGQERVIELVASVRAAHLVIRCQNPCGHPVAFEDGLPVTTRAGGHGIGAKSIRRAAEKYGGEARFELQEGVFTATVALPLDP